MKFGEMFNIIQAVSGRAQMMPTSLTLGLIMLRCAPSAADPRASYHNAIGIVLKKHLLRVWLCSRFST